MQIQIKKKKKKKPIFVTLTYQKKKKKIVTLMACLDEGGREGKWSWLKIN